LDSELKVAVVILNWNGKELLQKFLPSVVAFSGDAEVIVADNASTDDSVQFLRSRFQDVRVVELPQNYGFAEGYNRALKEVKADCYVLLNSDVEVTENWLDPVLGYMQQHPDVAVCQPRIRWYHQKEKFEYAGACGGMIDWLGYPFCRGRIFQSLEIDEGQYNDIADIFWATGACMFIRSEVFHSVGGFDASFFAHMEEIDLCWRIKHHGHNIRCIPGSVVFHMGGATLNKSNPTKTYYNFRNNLSMLYKNLPSGKLLKVIPPRLVLDGIAGIKFLLEGDLKDCLAVLRAHFAFYGRVLNGTVRREKKIGDKIGPVFNRSIIVEHYIKGKKKYSELKQGA
jgi:GT2 family glycosyltransferase